MQPEQRIKLRNLGDGGEFAKKVFQDVFISSMTTKLYAEQKKCKVEKSFNILPNKIFENDLLGRNQLVEKLANTIAINSSSIEKLILFRNACSDD
jgi:hypothetical protein